MKDLHMVSSSRELPLHLREFFINRISCGYLKYSIGNTMLQIRYPNLQLKYDACEVYNEFFDKAVSEGLPDEDQMTDMLLNVGALFEDDLKKLEYLPKQIEEFKIELLRNIYVPERIKKIRQYLDRAKEELNIVQGKKYHYHYATSNGVANFAKWQYIIQNSTYANGQLYDWGEGSLHSALNYYYSNYIDEDVIRTISRTSPWDGIWSASRKLNQLFHRDGVNITFDQQRLICWSMLYDNVMESVDRPIQKVIDDDDMLDGWLILERRKRDDESKKRFNEQKFGTAKGDDVFIPAKSVEEAREIMSLNSTYNRNIIQQRFKKLQEKGTVKEQEFDDVQQKLIMQMNRLQAERKGSRYV